MTDMDANFNIPELRGSFGVYLSTCLLRYHAPNSLSASVSPTGSGQRILLSLCLELAMKGRLRQLKEAGHVPSHNSHWGRLKGTKLRFLQDTGYVPSHKLHSDLYTLMKDVCPNAADALETSYKKLYKGRKSLSDFLKDVDNEVMDSRYGEINWELSRKRGKVDWGKYDRQIRRYDRRFFKRYDAAIIAVYQQANLPGLGQIPKGATLKNVVDAMITASRVFATWGRTSDP